MRSVPVMSRDLRHHLGQSGEQLACDHLLRRGFEIIERNYRTRWGELDIVALDGKTLAFCEVKARRLDRGGSAPLDAVHGLKQGKVRKMAAQWLVERTERPRADLIRFDAIGVVLDAQDRLVTLEHLEGAF
jgi:putative endonuclease